MGAKKKGEISKKKTNKKQTKKQKKKHKKTSTLLGFPPLLYSPIFPIITQMSRNPLFPIMFTRPTNRALNALYGVSLRRQRRNLQFQQTYQLNPFSNVEEEELTPQEVVALLNSYVIGQDAAKSEVAVALRERWRRLQLDHEKAVEITPKNMLVSGPSGCGKTEIIRRVSKIMKAPFVKVDASTFTRRGVVGANVQDMIVDLFDRAEDQSRELFTQETKEVARRAAIDILATAVEAHIFELETSNASSQTQKPASPSSPPTFQPDGTGPAPPLPAAASRMLAEVLKGTGASSMLLVHDTKDGQPGSSIPLNATKEEQGTNDKSDNWWELEALLGTSVAELTKLGEELGAFIRKRLEELEKEKYAFFFNPAT